MFKQEHQNPSSVHNPVTEGGQFVWIKFALVISPLTNHVSETCFFFI